MWGWTNHNWNNKMKPFFFSGSKQNIVSTLEMYGWSICFANLISASPCFSTFFSAIRVYLAQRRPSSILVGEWSHGDRRRIAKLCRLTDDQKHVENYFRSSHRSVTIMQPQPLTQPSFRQVIDGSFLIDQHFCALGCIKVRVNQKRRDDTSKHSLRR